MLSTILFTGSGGSGFFRIVRRRRRREYTATITARVGDETRTIQRIFYSGELVCIANYKECIIIGRNKQLVVTLAGWVPRKENNGRSNKFSSFNFSGCAFVCALRDSNMDNYDCVFWGRQ